MVYCPIFLDDAGGAPATALADLEGCVRPLLRREQTQIFVAIHGFNTSDREGARQYRRIARDLAKQAGPLGVHSVVVGVHWHSYPGPYLAWLPRMIGSRFISELGFPNALQNPYREKVRLARRCGRSGLRAVLFRLRDAFPGTPVHVLAHSLGAEILVRALAPEVGSNEKPGDPIEQPQRVLRIGMAILAGADLDHDVFTDEHQPAPRAALERVFAWWITVPRKNLADAVLELRRGAGRRDAVGNVGLLLSREDFRLLMARKALVIDNYDIPITHAITDYYTPKRLGRIARSVAYLLDPKAKPAQESELAALDRLAQLPDAELKPYLEEPDPTARLVARWRLRPEDQDYGWVRIIPTKGSPRESGVFHSRLRPVWVV